MEETQEASNSKEIMNPALESREELRSMICQDITEKLSSKRAPVPAKKARVSQ